jgi:hypothetical protein
MYDSEEEGGAGSGVGFRDVDVPPLLLSSSSSQSTYTDTQANNPYHVRRITAQFMRDHRDDFLPFLPSVDGEDMPGATDDGLMTPAQFEEYCHRVEKTAEWGGEPEVSKAEPDPQRRFELRWLCQSSVHSAVASCPLGG